MNHKTVQLPKLNLSLLVIGALVGLLAAIGYIAANHTTRVYLLPRTKGLTPPSSVEASYAYLSFDDLVRTADAIVTGYVQGISSTRWNQDSGEYWEYYLKEGGFDTIIVAQPYYEIVLTIERRLIAPSNLEDIEQLTVVVPAFSPVDGGESPGVQVGSEIMGFVVADEMPWFDGRVSFNKRIHAVELGKAKPILTIATSPESSFLQKNRDGSFTFKDAYQETAVTYSEETVSALIQKRQG